MVAGILLKTKDNQHCLVWAEQGIYYIASVCVYYTENIKKLHGVVKMIMVHHPHTYIYIKKQFTWKLDSQVC